MHVCVCIYIYIHTYTHYMYEYTNAMYDIKQYVKSAILRHGV